jgi:hypothetical protein
MKDQKITINVELTFTPYDLDDILTTAFEGGINYWCRYISPIMNEKGRLKGISEEEIMNPLLYYYSGVLALGGELILYDSESPDKWVLTLPMLMKGIKMYCEQYDILDKDEITTCDAGAADTIIQYALFDELVFG